MQKSVKRQRKGKVPHPTTLKSIEENKERFENVRIIRHLLLGDDLNLSMKSQVKASAAAGKC